MSKIDFFFNSDLCLFAFSSIAVPLAILIIGFLIYKYKPRYRLANGVALLILGSVILLLYPIVERSYSSTRMYPIDLMITTESILFTSIIIIEILTFCLGVYSIRKRIASNK
ncbi:MAG: hypothetical protein IAX22_02555 [Candidatus Bathyarchaeota archaeon]|nr:hypothetical protein [Candidatus Bathyarchaeota archaeon]